MTSAIEIPAAATIASGETRVRRLSRPKLRDLVRTLGRTVPRGVGGKGRLPVGAKDVDRVLTDGGRVVGYGWLDDVWGDAEILLAVGEELQSRLLATARESGMRVLGPNSFGVINNDPAVTIVRYRDRFLDPMRSGYRG